MNERIHKINLILLAFLIMIFVIIALLPSKVFAKECEAIYGGGERCIYNKSFEIEKKVRVKDEGSFKDKVSLDEDEWDETLQFRIRIYNRGDIEVNDMKMTDFLPDELIRVGGSGLTEYWDDFTKCKDEDCDDQRKEFIIEVEIDPDEFDREGEFEKCVVNKAEVEYKGDFEGADTATVCYGDIELKELPETGANATMIMTGLGLGLIGIGSFAKRKAR